MTKNNFLPRNDRWILQGINAFFVLLILLFLSVVLTRALLLEASIKDKVHDQTKTAAMRSAVVGARSESGSRCPHRQQQPLKLLR